MMFHFKYILIIFVLSLSGIFLLDKWQTAKVKCSNDVIVIEDKQMPQRYSDVNLTRNELSNYRYISDCESVEHIEGDGENVDYIITGCGQEISILETEVDDNGDIIMMYGEDGNEYEP